MSLLRATLAATLIALALPASAADLCALLAKHGSAVFGTALQAAPQCDKLGPTSSGAANNATGSDRLSIAIAELPGADLQIDNKRREKKEGHSVSDEPALGKDAVLERRDKGRVAAFQIADGGRYIVVVLRARDGVNDAYVDRARAFAKVVKATR
jgi:hypothetical protein